MTGSQFEQFLSDLCRSLRLRPEQRAAIREELEDHFVAFVEDLLAEGMPRAAAEEQALAEFGDAVNLAQRFGRIGRGRRWIMRSALAASIVAATALVTSFMVPDHPGNVLAPPRVSADDELRLEAGSPLRVAAIGEPVSDTGGLVREKLAKRIPEINFNDTPLEEVITYVGELTGVNVVVRWSSMEERGIQRDTPVTLKVKDVPAAEAFDLVMSSLDACGPQLAWEIQGSALIVAPQEVITGRTVVRVYDCRDLVRPALSAHERAEIESILEMFAPPGGTGATGATGEDSGGGRPADTKAVKRTPSGEKLSKESALDRIEEILRERRINELQELLVNTIEPDTWVDNGGETGRISAYEATLVIKHTPRVHEEVGRLLDGLLKMRSASAK